MHARGKERQARRQTRQKSEGTGAGKIGQARKKDRQRKAKTKKDRQKAGWVTEIYPSDRPVYCCNPNRTNTFAEKNPEVTSPSLPVLYFFLLIYFLVS